MKKKVKSGIDKLLEMDLTRDIVKEEEHTPSASRLNKTNNSQVNKEANEVTNE